MTIGETIENIKNTPLYRYETKRKEGQVSSLYHSLVMAIHALEKQIPKKPLKDKLREEGYCGCPICKHLVDSVSNYCEHCGQALDWTEEGET